MAAVAENIEWLEELDADPVNFTPADDEQLVECLKRPMWRLNNLYKIVTKDDDDEDDEGLVVTFKLNEAQNRLAKRLWYRNIVPKSRQLGFTTFSCILALDSALFKNNFQAGIIADTDPKAKKIMRDKVLFAYNNLPDQIKAAYPLEKEAAEELVFANGSSIIVSTTMRGGTTHFLHVSEFGRICAKFPHRAREIVTGSLPSVPINGISIIESTAEGPEGHFYKMTMQAKKHADLGKKLNKKEYRLHFYPWYEGPDNQMSPVGVHIEDDDHDYFDAIEAEHDITLSIRQRAWYVATREEEFSGDQQMMNQEQPSSVIEAFSSSVEGVYFQKEMTKARKEGRVGILPVMNAVPCMTFWDIGAGDGTAIWVVQYVAGQFRLIDFYEDWDEPYSEAVKWLQSLGVVWDTMYLPHDAEHVRKGSDSNKAPIEMLEELMPGVKFEALPRIQELSWGIQQTRDVFPLLAFHSERCAKGIKHIDLYKRKWNERQGRWSEQPDKAGGHSEAADALRQLAQAYAAGTLNIRKQPKKNIKRPNWRVV